MKRPLRIKNVNKVKLIIFLRRKGWGYSEIAEGLKNEYGIKAYRQNVRTTYLKYYRKFSKEEIDMFVVPDTL